MGMRHERVEIQVAFFAVSGIRMNHLQIGADSQGLYLGHVDLVDIANRIYFLFPGQQRIAWLYILFVYIHNRPIDLSRRQARAGKKLPC